MTNAPYSVIENKWITLKDGTRLAARIWMPDSADLTPVPAVLEFLPYRKRDGTSPRDESTYPVFASAGIAGVRVDIRGSGESDGVIDGEYTPLELDNACEIIAWIAEQAWCNGAVGMMGISWGGFNCLQVAALQPPALKAVISIASTVDRYNDDIHYKNGCQLAVQLSWAGTMLAYQSRAPDPELVGDRWRDMWMERLQNEPFFMEEWLEHQTRDDFWKHASICEDFDSVKIPSMVMAGWADGYRNTPIRAIEGMPDRAKALIGPWVHKYPHFAWPKPRADFHGEAIRWWDKWLRNADNGAQTLPQMRAYILDAVKPAPRRDHDAGFWIAKQTWQAPARTHFGVADARLVAQDDTTAAPKGKSADVFVKSPLDTGTASGEYFTLKPDAEMAIDQRSDDAGSLCFDSKPLEQNLDLLGRAEITLALACDADWANLCARLVDVHPDGTAARISVGVLNLAHRDPDGNYNDPKPMPTGEKVSVTVVFDACGYRLRAGHKLRLALSTAYWPMILPDPFNAGLTIDTASIDLSLPLLGDHEIIDMPEPENPDPLPTYIEHQPATTRREVRHNLTQNKTEYCISEDTGRFEHPDTGLSTRQIRDETWAISLDDPTSMRGHAVWTCDMERDGWFTRTVCTATLTCTKTDWRIAASVIAVEGDNEVYEKTWNRTIPRNFM
ncbi:CocE/NonD family hydrolase [Thalassospira mesophila]|uniref:Peptidase n=1 Tax=Thalassospira mesophila TaxID=1293891 RepID=A0A1Y2L022_9PROT|nr:CocE/NonD family hydrolase [Thalassospira mesophila]OSQ37396.1 peptidase [Thalassospira mesophila]